MRADQAARLPALDGVRALAVLGVIANHAGILGLGWLGVDVFFGLSGYLITGILLDAKAAGPSARDFFIPFYARRALRIFPLAWSVVLIVCAYRNEWSALGWYLGYLVNWLPVTPLPADLGHFWSLAVEEQFYLVWPALAFFLSRRGLMRASVAVIGLDILCRFVFSVWPPAFATAQFLDLATFGRADALAVGAILAQHERTAGWGREAWALPVALAGGAGIVLIRVLEKAQAVPLLTYNLKWPIIALTVGAGLVHVLVRPPRPLQWPWLVWIGRVSYGIYVIHALFGHWLHERFPLSQAPLIFVIQVAVTFPIAALSYYLFETPILNQKRRWPMPGSRERATPAVLRTAQ